MANLIFFSIILSLFVNFTVGSVSLSGIDRTFQLMYKGVVESSVLSIDEEGNPCAPYFSKKLFEINAEQYFAMNLPRYVEHYVTSYYYFNLNDKSFCTSYCQGVKVSLKADISSLYKYDKAKEFYIVKKNV